MALDTSGWIYECAVCGLLFRRPYPSPEQLVEQYGKLSVDRWESSSDRFDFGLAADIIQKSCSSGRVLDVGCFRGDFLAMLPDHYEKYGVEPARAARQVAEQRGIRLIGHSLAQIEWNDRAFDVVTIIDVIEHLPFPMAVMEQVAGLLRPDGVLIVSTGNSAVLPWRLMRRDYWYYTQDHVSFFNPKWFRWAARKVGLTVTRIDRFSHSRQAVQSGARLERWRELARCLAFWTVEQGRGRTGWDGILRRLYPFSRVYQWKSPPGTSLWRDHILLCARKGL